MTRLFLVGLMAMYSSFTYAEIENNSSDNCNYHDIKSDEYRISESKKRYITNNFLKDPNLEDYQQRNYNYDDLANNSFKFYKSTETKESLKYRQEYLESFRFRDIDLDNNTYIIDMSYNIEVITNNCQKFYYEPEDYRLFKYSFIRNDGREISVNDYKQSLSDALIKKEINTTVNYDKFDKNYTIKTDYFKNYMIRGYYDINKKNKFIQIYTDIHFSGDWHFFDTAKDEYGDTHEVTRIDQEADCKPRSYTDKCFLTETIGISVSEKFLRKNKNGFSMKIYGKKSIVLDISGDVVQSFLKEVDKLK